MRMVIHPPVEETRLDRILEAAGDMEVINAPDDPSALAAMQEANAFFGKLTPSMLANAPNLRWVQSPTVSLEHYIFPELARHPCVLTNMRGLFSDVIADQVFGYIICFARNLHIYVRQQSQALWAPLGGEEERVSFATGPGRVTGIDRAHMHLSDATMGIVGLGEIGREIAARGLAFHMRVIAVDPVTDLQDAPKGVEAVWRLDQLDDLLAQSDFVVIAAPHTPETERLFDRGRIQKMKRTAYLINIGRGAIVDLTDLNAALDADELGGAALDVFQIEPLPADDPLWKRENVIITPHVAGYSMRIAERHLAVLLVNIRRFREGRALANVADKEKWY